LVNFNPTVSFDGLADNTNGDGMETGALPNTFGSNGSTFTIATRPTQNNNGSSSGRALIAHKASQYPGGGSTDEGHFLGYHGGSRGARLFAMKNSATAEKTLTGTAPAAGDESAALLTLISTKSGTTYTANVSTNAKADGSVTDTYNKEDIGGVYEIGHHSGGNSGQDQARHYTGDIAEIITYDTPLSALILPLTITVITKHPQQRILVDESFGKVLLNQTPVYEQRKQLLMS